MPFAPTHFSPRVSLATMSFHVFSAIRELNFVEVQKITIMFSFYMENLPDLRSTNKLFLEMSFNPLPRHPPPLF